MFDLRYFCKKIMLVMKTSNFISRRNFIGKAAMTAGMTSLDANALFGQTSEINEQQQQTRLPRDRKSTRLNSSH